MKNREQGAGNSHPDRQLHAGEQGFMLLGLIVVIAIIMLVLGIAAEDMAHSIRRTREEESVRRANQYVRAIQLFYLKTGTYPNSVKQLENTNTIRYLRQQYVDPLTGKADYRLIPVGQNKTQVKGFFGQPLAGIAGTGLGALAGAQSPGMGPSGAAGTSGAAGATGGAGAAGASALPGAIGSGGTDSAGAAAAAGTNTGFGSNPGLSAGAGFGSNSSAPGSGASTSPFAGGTSGPFMGIGSSATGNSILVVNEQTTYQTWEFLYDPRIEKLKAAAALNSGVPTAGAGGLGQTPTANGLSNNPLGTNNPANPTGATNPNINGGGGSSGAGNPNGGASPTGP